MITAALHFIALVYGCGVAVFGVAVASTVYGGFQSIGDDKLAASKRLSDGAFGLLCGFVFGLLWPRALGDIKVFMHPGNCTLPFTRRKVKA